MDYQGSAVDLSEDFTVAASNVITTLAFGKEVSILPPTAQFVPLSRESEMDCKICFSSMNSCGCGRPVLGCLFMLRNGQGHCLCCLF